MAAEAGHEAVVRLLLERGAKVNAPNKEGKTLLDVACRQGYTAVVRLMEAALAGRAP